METLYAHISDPRLRRLADTVEKSLLGTAPLGVAFSGGVDSTLLLALAARALKPINVVALVGVSASLPATERADARELARLLEVRYVEVATHEDQIKEYRRNHEDRCYFCKAELFSRIDHEVVSRYGLAAVAYGETGDDKRATDRPGSRAATQHGVLRPLADADLTKSDVRELAYILGLPNWDKPAMPCLASRIPHYSEVLPAKLRQVETTERRLRSFGFNDLRVRHHGEIARIEIPRDSLSRAISDPIRGLIIEACRSAGFTHVTLDLSGLRSAATTMLPLSVSERIHDDSGSDSGAGS
jgi:pyridinium-3,5-biscarboxylic acid mononucleotide sulfurtransferase